MRFPVLLCQKQEVHGTNSRNSSAKPPNTQGGTQGTLWLSWRCFFIKKNLMQKYEITPMPVWQSPDQRRVCYKYCQHLLRGFTLLDLANTNKHLRAELAHRALAFGLLTNELSTVQPFNFIKLPRRFQLKAWVKWHTAVFSETSSGKGTFLCLNTYHFINICIVQLT